MIIRYLDPWGCYLCPVVSLGFVRFVIILLHLLNPKPSTLTCNPQPYQPFCVQLIS